MSAPPNGPSAPRLRVRLVKAGAADVIRAAIPFKMEGWVRPEAARHDAPEEPMYAIEVEGRGIIGQAGLVEWPPGRGKASATIAIFDPDLRRRGIGSLVVQMLLNHAFMALALEQVMVRADAHNQAAVRCYRKAGFADERALRDGALLLQAVRASWLRTFEASGGDAAGAIGTWAEL